jgi:hypothetical protein
MIALGLQRVGPFGKLPRFTVVSGLTLPLSCGRLVLPIAVWICHDASDTEKVSRDTARLTRPVVVNYAARL